MPAENKTLAEEAIREIINRETYAWDTQDVILLLSIFHPEMVWPWPPTNSDHDPITWEMPLGKFDYARWSKFYSDFFQTHTLVHNKRHTMRIVISPQGDGAFAVVDIDTLWKDSAGKSEHWVGRVCKGYSKSENGWKLIMHTGVLHYDQPPGIDQTEKT